LENGKIDMTDEEINIEIAEYCGWRKIREQDYQPFGTDPYIDGPSQVWVGIHQESDVDSKEYEVIPDYCNDLNAINEAVKTFFKENNCSDYIDNLENICKTDGWTIMSIEERFKIINATARQRAEAFLKTIGKYK